MSKRRNGGKKPYDPKHGITDPRRNGSDRDSDAADSDFDDFEDIDDIGEDGNSDSFEDTDGFDDEFEDADGSDEFEDTDDFEDDYEDAGEAGDPEDFDDPEEFEEDDFEEIDDPEGIGEDGFEDIDDPDGTGEDGFEEDDFENIDDPDDIDEEGFEDLDDPDGTGEDDFEDIDDMDAAFGDYPDNNKGSDPDGKISVMKFGLTESGERTDQYDPDDYTEEDFESVGEGSNDDVPEDDEERKNRKSGIIWKVGLGFLAFVIIFAVWALATKSGNVFVGSIIAKFGHSKFGTKIDEEEVQFILTRYGISLSEEEFDSVLAKGNRDKNQYLLKLIFDKYGVNIDAEAMGAILDELERSGKTVNVDQVEMLLGKYGVDTGEEAAIRAIFDRFDINVGEEEFGSILEKTGIDRNEAILKVVMDAYGLSVEEDQLKGALGGSEELVSAEQIILILSGFGINEYADITPTPVTIDKEIEIRSEDYVKTYLIFGIESVSVDDSGNITFDRSSIGNTDAILLVSINSKDKTIKMTSILRDTFVEIPGFFANKINAVYSLGAKGSTTAVEAHEKGAALLVKVIENTFRVKISGWACVNFKSFERIVDRLGGIDIELGEAEAKYLNKTNYISNPANRTVSPGWNHLNGNQVLGYCRVRKEATLGGANNDYGRTLRHRRVINAVIKKYTSSSLTELIPIMSDILGYVYTNLSEEEFTDALTRVIENRIFTSESLRLPVDGTFYDSGTNGIDNGSGRKVTWTLVMGKKKEGTFGSAQIEENVKKLHEFIFLDGKEISNTADGKTE